MAKRIAQSESPSRDKRFKPSSENETVDGLSPIEELPGELMRLIIEFAPEAVFDLRMASKLLYSRVRENAVQLAATAIIAELNISGVFDGCDKLPSAIAIKIRVPACNSKAFERRLILCQPPIDLISRICCGYQNHLKKIKEYFLHFYVEQDHENVLKWLGECMGTRIDLVSLDDCNERRKLAAISTLLDGIRFDKLKIATSKLSNDGMNHLLNTIEAHHVSHLSLWLGRVAISDPEGSLYNLSSLVQSMRYYQAKLDGINHKCYLFGMQNAEWAPIIIKMLSRKLNMLALENPWFPEFLSSASVEMLKQKLPQLGKKVWFRSTIDKTKTGFRSTVNDHRIRVTPSTPKYNGSFVVKHLSRLKENFNYVTG